MKSRKYGRDQTSCDKPTTHWGLYLKASSSSEQCPHQIPQWLWDWWAYMTWMPFDASMVWPTAPGVGRRARMREQLLTTCRWCTTGLAWSVTNVTTTHQPHQTLFATMARRTVYPPERETPMSQLHRNNYQQGTGRINPTSSGIWMEESGGTGFPWAAVSGTPLPIGTALEEIQMEKAPPTNLQHPITILPHILTRQPPTTHELHKTYPYKLKTTLEVGEIKD